MDDLLTGNPVTAPSSSRLQRGRIDNPVGLVTTVGGFHIMMRFPWLKLVAACRGRDTLLLCIV